MTLSPPRSAPSADASRPASAPSVPHILFSLLYNVCRAVVLAVLEALRLYVAPFRRPTPPPGCVFYEGTVMHTRRAPERHSFSYPVRYCLVEITDDSPASPYVASLLASGERLTSAQARALRRRRRCVRSSRSTPSVDSWGTPPTLCAYSRAIAKGMPPPEPGMTPWIAPPPQQAPLGVPLPVCICWCGICWCGICWCGASGRCREVLRLVGRCCWVAAAEALSRLGRGCIAHV